MGVGKCTGCLIHGMIPKACILYFADIELARYIHTPIPANISIHVQCLSKGKNFFFDLIKAKNSFLGGLYKVVVVLADTPYYHTPFYIGVEVLQVTVLL